MHANLYDVFKKNKLEAQYMHTIDNIIYRDRADIPGFSRNGLKRPLYLFLLSDLRFR